jgi:hypothetical protein
MSVELIIYLVFSASIASILIILVELLTVLAERGKKKGIEWEQFLHSAHSKLILPIDCITAAPHVKKINPVNKVYGRLKKKLNKLFEKKIRYNNHINNFKTHLENNSTPAALFYCRFPNPLLWSNPEFVKMHNARVKAVQEQFIKQDIEFLEKEISSINDEIVNIQSMESSKFTKNAVIVCSTIEKVVSESFYTFLYLFIPF